MATSQTPRTPQQLAAIAWLIDPKNSATVYPLMSDDATVFDAKRMATAGKDLQPDAAPFTDMKAAVKEIWNCKPLFNDKFPARSEGDLQSVIDGTLPATATQKAAAQYIVAHWDEMKTLGLLNHRGHLSTDTISSYV